MLRSELVGQMSKSEYRKFVSTGANEPERRRNGDYYTYKHNPVPKGELTGYAKPGVVVIPKNGSPRFVETGTEKLDKYYAKKK